MIEKVKMFVKTIIINLICLQRERIIMRIRLKIGHRRTSGDEKYSIYNLKKIL